MTDQTEKILKWIAYFLAGSVGGLFLFIRVTDFLLEKQEVLGESVSAQVSDTTQIPTKTPTPTRNPSLTLSPTPTLLPTPTLTPTSSVSPRPTITPTPIEPPENLRHLFDQYSGNYGIDKQILINIAWCESKFNPGAVNGPYLGLYQFHTDRWVTYRTQMGHDPNPDLRADANEAIKTAAYVISLGKLFMWPNCSR